MCVEAPPNNFGEVIWESVEYVITRKINLLRRNREFLAAPFILSIKGRDGKRRDSKGKKKIQKR